MSPKYGISSEFPVKILQEAIPTGNGTLGAMLIGDPANERIVLNPERHYERHRDPGCAATKN